MECFPILVAVIRSSLSCFYVRHKIAHAARENCREKKPLQHQLATDHSVTDVGFVHFSVTPSCLSDFWVLELSQGLWTHLFGELSAVTIFNLASLRASTALIPCQHPDLYLLSRSVSC